MDARQLHRMNKGQLIDFALEYSTWIGPGRLESWSKNEVLNLCLETLQRPPLSEEQRAAVKASR